MTIHSGLFPESRIALMILSRLMMSLVFCLLLVARSSPLRSSTRVSRLSRRMSFRTASAPVSASNESPYFSRHMRNSSSVRSCFSLSWVSPGSMTT